MVCGRVRFVVSTIPANQLARATDLMNKMDKLLKKYGVKVVGAWTSIPEHTNIAVYDAPSMEAMFKFSMEPEVMAWLGYNTTELKPIMTLGRYHETHGID